MAVPIEAFADTSLQPQDLRLGGRWPALLSDLACMGPMWASTESPGIALAHRADLAGIRVKSNSGLLSRPGYALRLMLDRCRSIRPTGEDPGQVSIESDGRGPLLTLKLGTPGQGYLLQTLLSLHTGFGTPTAGAGDSSFELPALAAARIHDKTPPRDSSRTISDGIDSRDIAELCGRQAFRPARLRGRGWAVSVDPALVPCALEALADQVVPLRVVTGNDALAQRLDIAFFGHKRDGAWQHLSGDSARLRIDTRELDTAWVFQRTASPTLLRELRLYDSHGHALAFIGVQPTPEGTEPPIWRILTNALLK